MATNHMIDMTITFDCSGKARHLPLFDYYFHNVKIMMT